MAGKDMVRVWSGSRSDEGSDWIIQANKRATPILRLLREVEVHCNGGMDVVSACRVADVSDKTYYAWRRKFNGERHWFEGSIERRYE